MRALALLIVLVGAACADTEPGPSVEARQGELALRSLAVAFESADTALVLELFWPQATYDDFAAQITYEGIEEIVGYVTAVHAWGDDVYKNVGRVHLTETGAVGEWVFSAVQNRPLGALAPIGTGREVVLNGVTILEMDRGRILRAADYVDTQPMLSQLGARVVPGGGDAGEGP